jgi:hypothetical protein
METMTAEFVWQETFLRLKFSGNGSFLANCVTPMVKSARRPSIQVDNILAAL